MNSHVGVPTSGMGVAAVKPVALGLRRLSPRGGSRRADRQRTLVARLSAPNGGAGEVFVQ
jgi:hypothetical protein